MRKHLIPFWILLLIILLSGCSDGSKYSLDIQDARLVNRHSKNEYFHEFGDSDGPFRFVSGSASSPGESITFSTTVNGEKVEWEPQVKDGVFYWARYFQNKQGNGFVVIHINRMQKGQPVDTDNPDSPSENPTNQLAD